MKNLIRTQRRWDFSMFSAPLWSETQQSCQHSAKCTLNQTMKPVLSRLMIAIFSIRHQLKMKPSLWEKRWSKICIMARKELTRTRLSSWSARACTNYWPKAKRKKIQMFKHNTIRWKQLWTWIRVPHLMSLVGCVAGFGDLHQHNRSTLRNAATEMTNLHACSKTFTSWSS